MTQLNEDYIADLSQAVVKAICEVSGKRQQSGAAGKGGTLYIGSAEVCQMLTLLLSDFLEGVLGLETPGEVRRMSDTVARKILQSIAETRRHREETGGAPLPSIIIRSN